MIEFPFKVSSILSFSTVETPLILWHRFLFIWRQKWWRWGRWWRASRWVWQDDHALAEDRLRHFTRCDDKLWERKGCDSQCTWSTPELVRPFVFEVFSSDKTAYHFTKSSNSFSLHDSYPFEDVNWGLIGTKDTITFIHIDSDGLCTHIYILCGGKIWFFLRPKPGSEQLLSSRHMFLNQTFRLDRVLDIAHYDLEAVALTPGDLLWVVPSICIPGS